MAFGSPMMLDDMLDGMLDDVPPYHEESAERPLRAWDEEAHPLLLSSSPMSLDDENSLAHHEDIQNRDGTSTYHPYSLENDDASECIATQPGQILQSEDDVPVPESATHSIVPNPSSSRDQTVAQIEAVFECIADALLAERNELSITLTPHRLVDPHGGMGELHRMRRTRSTSVNFPGNSAEEAWRFTVIVRLLELMHEAITNDTVVTKRDMYYRDPALFGKQSVVDRYIDQIALAFDIPRSCLNVTAAAKGLIAGAASLCRRDGSRLDLTTTNEGSLIANVEEILSVEMNNVRWVLVIEKEATFQSIIMSDEWQSLRWHGIIITGKGYPDIATRAMLRFITQATPRNGFVKPHVLGLVDYDPDGLAILSTYKYGSNRFVHERESLVVPEIRWLGLNASHITDCDQTHRNQGLMPLTKRDRLKARKMLDQERMSENGGDEWRGQLQVMLVLNLKAELQILDTIPGALVDLIKSAVQ